MPIKTVDLLFDETGLSLEEVSRRSGVTAERVEAIAQGRWTPSPDERSRIASAFGVEVEQVSWGHSMNPRNIRYHRFGLRETF